MAIANKIGAVPLQFRLRGATDTKARILPKVAWLGVSALKRIWWHTKSYLPILSILVLAFGSLMLLQCHWLYRRLLQSPVRAEEVLEDVG